MAFSDCLEKEEGKELVKEAIGRSAY